MLAFSASRRACRPTAVYIRQQTGNRIRPASREARCRAAVTPQPSCFPSSTPAPYGRGVGCRGSPPAASRRACRPTAVCARRQTGNHTRPASREACRRAAVTPRPSRFPSSTPAPYGRGVGCRGSPPAASRRACRPTAVCARRQTGNHTRPASREACRRAAVTPRPSRFPSSTPAPYGRGVGCRGGHPLPRGPLPSVPKAPYLSV